MGKVADPILCYVVQGWTVLCPWKVESPWN